MKERPILWSAPMVLALLAGRKTQTRRIVKPQPGEGGAGVYDNDSTQAAVIRKTWKPYALPGDRLWGRETHAILDIDGCQVVAYRASCPDGSFDFVNPVESTVQRIEVQKWKPSIFMFREMSRLQHEVTAVRVERLQDITDDDARAEGLERRPNSPNWFWPGGVEGFGSPRACYLRGWDTINGQGASAKNPWVWAIGLKAVMS